MRIGLDAHAALDPKNGAGHFTLDLLEELARQTGEGDQLVVFHTGPEPPASLAWLFRHDRLVRVSVPARARRSAAWWSRFAVPAVERMVPGGDGAALDVLHCLRPPFLPSQARRRVLTVGAVAPDDGAKLPPSFRKALLLADAVVVTSDRLRRELCRRFEQAQPRKLAELERRIRVLSPGVHPRFFIPPRPATVVGLCDAYPFLGEPYLLAPGGVANPELSLRLLIEACRLARDAEPGLPPLVLLGSPEDSAFVAPILEADQNRGRVFWLQNLESDLLPALYRGAQLVLYPGLDHAFGLPVLEALAMGVPGIVGDRCGVAELVTAGDGVEAVDGVDARAWADALQALHRDEDRRRAIAERARACASAHTSEQVGRRHWDLYRELARW
jgi:glycosyltransferase involved in cell wall biosynthesis